MLHAGLGLGRRRIDACLLSSDGEIVDEWTSPPDADGLRGCARFVPDRLEEHGWEVLIADAAKVKGLAPLACKTDRIDARVLATLSARDLVPEIWLADPSIRRERDLAPISAASVRHRTTLKNRIDAALIASGHPCPVFGLFGHAGRELLDRLALPDPSRANIGVRLQLIGDLDLQIAALTVQLKRRGADHRSIPLPVTAPGIGWINGYTIASEIGHIDRFASPMKLCGYTGLCPRVKQSGATDARRPISKHGPKYLRWALFEAALNACKHPYYAERYQHTKRRLGRQRGPKVAQIDLARRLTEPIWHMLTRNQPCAPAGATLV